MKFSTLLPSILLATGLVTATLAGTSIAQSYPTKPVTLVVPFSAGGPTDILARSLAAAMSKNLGQAVVVENRIGAGGTIAAGAVAKAAPDGYTLLIHHIGMATAPTLYRKLPFNALTDFTYIGLIADAPMTLLGRKDLPPADMAALIKYAKEQGNKINLGNAGLGAASQLCGTLLQQALGVGFTAIPYSGTSPAMIALVGGQLDLLCDQTTQTLPQIKGNTVKLYGVTTATRLPYLPDSPTLREGGLKDFEIVVWHGLYAPKNTPAPIAARLNEALKAALKDPTLVAKAADLGLVIVPEAKQTPAAMRAWVKDEITKWAPLLKAAGQYAD